MECKVNEPSERLPRSCAALDNLCIPQVAVQKNNRHDVSFIFPSLDSSLLSRVDRERSLKRRKEGRGGSEREREKKEGIDRETWSESLCFREKERSSGRGEAS